MGLDSYLAKKSGYRSVCSRTFKASGEFGGQFVTINTSQRDGSHSTRYLVVMLAQRCQLFWPELERVGVGLRPR